MSPVISVIIPCYNSGNYLLEAIESVKIVSKIYPYEIIITDDGSSDQNTINILSKLSKSSEYLILHQENKGPASARNTAVKRSNGEFLIFLDSDNKIKKSYVEKAIEILNNDAEVGVVYANPSFFGVSDEKRFFSAQPFSIYTLLVSNYIDMCSVIRKKVWESVEGFDEERILIGHEDWEFWIRIAQLGWKFFHLNEELYYYRVMPGSLITSTNEGNADIYKKKLKYIYEKHFDLFIKLYAELSEESIYYKQDKNNPTRSFFKYLKNKYLKKSRKD